VGTDAEGGACEDQAQSLLERLSLAEKLAMLDGDTPFWSGMAATMLRDASHRRPWPAGRPCPAGPGVVPIGSAVPAPKR